jgi:uncharacterized protein (TIGR00369 family)
MTLLEKIEKYPLPFAELMGVVFESAELERVTAKMVVRENLCTSGRAVHGGAVMALADTVGAMATYLNPPEGAKGTTTIESKTNFFRPAPAGTTVRATAGPLHRGSRTQVWQTRIETEDGRLVALVTQTQLVL